jgi:protein phosphatase
VGEDELSVAHVGDSRLYRLRDGRFERLTDDHSLVEELVRQGRLTPQEADEHPQRSIITRALGPDAGVEPDSRTWPARDGDVYLLCSDGLTSMVPEARVAEILQGSAELDAVGRALVDAANEAGGRDNITVVLFRLEDVEPAHAGASLPATEQATATIPPTPAAPRAQDVRAAAAAAEPTVTPRRPRAPRQPAPLPEAPRRRRRRVPVALLVAVVLLSAVGLGFWIASQSVYFVGTTSDGFVAVYRGLPYDLPVGLDLYSENYESGVAAASLPARQRSVVTNHKLRSLGDANDLVRQLETGELGS